MKKLLRHILIGLAAAGFVLAAGAVLLFNRPTLGWQVLSVPTGSMRPTIGPGSLVLVHKQPLSSLKVGDVITHTNPLTMRTTLTHRIIKKYKVDGTIQAFITKGDANPSPDPPVVGGLVQGRMVAHVPYVGELFMWAKTWTGIAVLIYIPALIIMTQETRRLALYLKQMKPYYLEGWEPKHESIELNMPAVPAAAAAVVVLVVVIAGVGWQTGRAHANAQVDYTMLVTLPHNVVETKAAGTSQTTTPSTAVTTPTTGTTMQSGCTGTHGNASGTTSDQAMAPTGGQAQTNTNKGLDGCQSPANAPAAGQQQSTATPKSQ